MFACAAMCFADTRHVPADYPKIQAAIDASSDGDEIVVGPGTYREAINFKGKGIWLHSSDGAATTTIDGSGNQASAVTCRTSEGPATVLEGFAVRGEFGTKRGGTYVGAGIYTEGASPSVRNCTLAGRGSGLGGGLFSSGGSPTITGCTFSDCSGSRGGAMYCEFGSPRISDSKFTSNTADSNGGAIYGRSTIVGLTNCLFIENSAAVGGAIYNDQSGVELTECTFRTNSAILSGGAISGSAAGDSTLVNCSFVGNSSTKSVGGAIRLANDNNATLSNCVFADNSAKLGGGAVQIEFTVARFTGCSFGANMAPKGGALLNESSDATITNCILWGDSAGELAGFAAVTYSDVQGGASGVGNVKVDPKYVDAENGDLHLADGSPCIDAGTNAALGWGSDLDGQCRITDGDRNGVAVIDMGAFETSGAALDCNDDGVCDTQQPAEFDCNRNFIPDECDLASGISLDQFPPGGDGIPDECQRVLNITQSAYSSTIQAAIDGAVDGDELAASAGTYHETIDFNGKSVFLRSMDGASATIIDGKRLNLSVVTCANGEGPQTILAGFTIKNGFGTFDDRHFASVGGGMRIVRSSPTVRDCVFSANALSGAASTRGGGVYCEDASPLVTGCTFSKNAAAASNIGQGGGMYVVGGSPTILGCAFRDNTVTGTQNAGGAGIAIDGGEASVINCTFTGNLTDSGRGAAIYSAGSARIVNCATYDNSCDAGGAIFVDSGETHIANCVLWGDSPDEIVGVAIVEHSDIQGGYAGERNLDADPVFEDPDNADFRLAAGSPCIDSGLNSASAARTDADGNCRIMDGDNDGAAVIDMGPFESLGAVLDCNGNGVCDTQEEGLTDCNHNFIPDICDFADGSSRDCNGNGFPDECDIADGVSSDCNANGVPDECDVGGGASSDCDADGVPDECELTENDCNENGFPDNCDIADGTSADCNGNGIPDECEPTIQNVTRDTYYCTIQAALDDAFDGDEVVVSSGTFHELLDFYGKAVFLHSSAGAAVTVIDGVGLDGPVIFCRNGEGPQTVVQGFTITNGASTNDAGMFISHSGPTVADCIFTAVGGLVINSGTSLITDCIFEENKYESVVYVGGGAPTIVRCAFVGNSGITGAAISNSRSTMKIVDCEFRHNSASDGGALFNWNCPASVIVTGCVFDGNVASNEGGAIHNWNSNVVITNCTFSANSSGGKSAAVYNSSGSTFSAVNCIFWDNSSGEIRGSGDVTYSDIQGGYSGTGNINADPRFIDPANADFHLAADSPCMDTGNNDSVPPDITRDLDGRLRIWDGNNDGVATVDMGAYEFASPLYADMNCDGAVNFNDIDAFVTALIGRPEYEHDYPGCNYALADINADGAVDFNDIDPFVDCLINGYCP